MAVGPRESEAERGQMAYGSSSSIGENEPDRQSRRRSTGLWCIVKKMDIIRPCGACDRFATEFTLYRIVSLGKPSKNGFTRHKERRIIPRHCSICVFSVNKKDYERLYGSGSLDDDS